MKCNTPSCAQEATVHFAEVSRRRLVQDTYFCPQHAPDLLDRHRSRNRAAQDPAKVLQGSVAFDVDLVAFKADERQQVYLQEVDGPRFFLLELGYFEVSAVYNIIKGLRSPRPLTHAAMASLITSLGGRLQDVLVDQFDEQGAFFYAKLRISRGEELLLVDLRPSDALALALYCDVPFLVSAVLLPEVPR